MPATLQARWNRLWFTAGQPHVVMGWLLLALLAPVVIAPFFQMVHDTAVWQETDRRISREAEPGQWTAFHYDRVFSSRLAHAIFYRPLLNSLATSLSISLLAMLIGGSLAWLLVRTDLPFRRALSLFAVPLLAFVSLMAPAIARSNTVVMIPSEKHPLSATDFYQVLDTSDVPPGVVNIVTGVRDHLTKTLIQHEDVDGVWYFGPARGSYYTEHESAANMKRTWVDYGLKRDWLSPEQGEGHEFLHEATQVKNIWVPTGE